MKSARLPGPFRDLAVYILNQEDDKRSKQLPKFQSLRKNPIDRLVPRFSLHCPWDFGVQLVYVDPSLFEEPTKDDVLSQKAPIQKHALILRTF